MATRVSMLGAPWMRLVKPLVKNFLLMSRMMAERIICTRPMATWFPSNQAGMGQPHM